MVLCLTYCTCLLLSWRRDAPNLRIYSPDGGWKNHYRLLLLPESSWGEDSHLSDGDMLWVLNEVVLKTSQPQVSRREA